MINTNNWTYCCYTNDELKALITFGMSPESIENMDYYCTVLKNNQDLKFQKKFDSLADSINYINQKYENKWSFTNLTVNKSSSGCSSCVAH
ncbi:MAG: hypothetical protein N4A33_02325 [Bacteriovoracaceae bacterium]|jgi:hypothetical protein|nr:hypothetical protein [Bacteriovoracaceae bacterium]